MKKMLITGGGGGLGAVLREYFSKIYEVIALTSSELDVTDGSSVEQMMEQVAPEIVLHCAAIVNADQAERDKDRTYAVNVKGTEHIVKACKKHHSLLVFFSSDYVFSGNEQCIYTEENRIDPINYYGISKILGEQMVKDMLEEYYILRVSWLFGPYGTNFLQKIMARSHEQEIFVVDDQVGSPTYTLHIAKAVEQLLEKKMWGTYHLTNENFCSWAEYAEKILELCNSKTVVTHVDSNTYQTLAPRPKNSKLSKEKLYQIGIQRLPTWDEALIEYFHASAGNKER